MSFSDIFSKNIETEAAKIIKARGSGGVAAGDEDIMLISLEHKYPSEIYRDLHLVQHLTSMYPEELTEQMMTTVVGELTECFTYNTFNASTVRHILLEVHQLVVVVIAKRSELVTKEVIDKLGRFFGTASFQEFLDANQENGKFVCLG